MQTELDHLVVVAPTLDSGLDHVERALGRRLPPGGRHPLMGTWNHVARIGPAVFLEVIAVDPLAPPPGRPRWFGLDIAPSAPRLAHWVIRTRAMAAVYPRLPPSVGPAIPVTRGGLRWHLTVPADGALPEGGAFPSVIEWAEGSLPPAEMPDIGLRLDRLVVAAPAADRLASLLAPVFDDPAVVLEPAAEVRLTAEFTTPDGPRVLV